MNTHPLQNVGW